MSGIEVRTYDELREFIEMFREGHIDLFIIRGPPGTGKTFNVNDLFSTQEHVYLTTHVTPLQAYIRMFEASDNGLPVIVDDVDHVVTGSTVTALLKQAGDTYAEKKIQWNSTTHHVGDDTEIPEEFTTTSSVCLIGNDLDNIHDAILDRGTVIDFVPDREELEGIMERMVDESDVTGADEVLDLIYDYWNISRYVSLRTLENGLQYRSGSGDWEFKVLRDMSPSYDKAVIVDCLRTNQSVSDAATEFAERTGLTERTFYEKKADL